MNTRTNLRTWRQDAVYCITITERGGYIKAELEAIAVGGWSLLTLDGMAERLRNSGLAVYMIKHNNKITTPQKAIDEAVRRFEIDKKGDKSL